MSFKISPGKPFGKIILVIIITTLQFSTLKAQYINTVPERNADTGLHKKINWQLKKSNITFRSFALPAVMIAYGFTTLNSDGLKDFNEDVKKEVWTENPHKQIHIDNYLQFVPAIAVYGLNISGIKGKNNLIDRSIMYVMSNVILNATVFSLKKITKQQRPDGSNYQSFPSGHTAEAFASAEFLRQEYKDVSPWYGIAGYVIATATGYLRMYNDKHWLSDVVTGAGIGMASTKLAYWIYPKLKRTFFKKRNVNTMLMPYYNNGSGGISMVHNFH
ncbi:MAG: phosphatase PAP2 family protein [Ferruginibacter sp.]